MLAKILSGKSFLAQIILGAVFFLLLSFRLNSENLLWESASGIIFFILNLIAATLFFIYSPFFKKSGIPLWYFLIWSLVFSGIVTDFRLCISLFFASLMFWRLLIAERNPDNKNFAFEIGILLSIAAFFYPPSVFLSGFLIFNYIYMQSLNFRVMLLFILGFILPLALGLQILYLIDELSWLQTLPSEFYLNYWQSPVWWLLSILLLILIAWVDHLSHASTQDISKRHGYFLGFLYFLNWMIILILFAGKNTDSLFVLGLPVSIFLGRFTQFQKAGWLKEFFLWAYLIFMAAFYFRNEILLAYENLLGNVSF